MVRALLLLACAGCRLHFDDGGPADARTVDAAPTLCELSTTLVCDDFSSAPPASATYGDLTWLPTGGRIGGGVSAHSIGNMPVSTLEYPIPVQTSGSLYLRFYANVAPGPVISTFEVMGELNNTINTGGQQKISADLFNGDLYTVGAPFSGGGPASTRVIERGRWSCIELHIVIDATAGEIHLAVDGTEIIGRTQLNTLIPSGFSDALLSAVGSASDPEFTATYDDFVVALAPIGC